MLSLIPKRGNLKLPKNVRGIQMMKSLACFYDRIIADRLKLWLSFHDDQTAFQRWKFTLFHIFTMRIFIEIAKKLGITLYIASVDIENVFDNVLRLLLLKKLVKLVIDKCILFALKQLYSFSICVIKFQWIVEYAKVQLHQYYYLLFISIYCYYSTVSWTICLNILMKDVA